MHHILPSGTDGPRDGRLRVCEHPGCLKTTRRGKPACPAHLELVPDWAAARDGWQAYQDEVDRLAAGVLAAELVLRGVVAEDVRTELRRGARTLGRIADDLTLPSTAVVVVARALALAGEARLSVPLEQLGDHLPKRVIAELILKRGGV